MQMKFTTNTNNISGKWVQKYDRVVNLILERITVETSLYYRKCPGKYREFRSATCNHGDREQTTLIAPYEATYHNVIFKVSQVGTLNERLAPYFSPPLDEIWSFFTTSKEALPVEKRFSIFIASRIRKKNIRKKNTSVLYKTKNIIIFTSIDYSCSLILLL